MQTADFTLYRKIPNPGRGVQISDKNRNAYKMISRMNLKLKIIQKKHDTNVTDSPVIYFLSMLVRMRSFSKCQML